jgi:hypothetical protein
VDRHARARKAREQRAASERTARLKKSSATKGYAAAKITGSREEQMVRPW